MRRWEESVVHTKTGKSFRGIIRRTHGRWIVMSPATLLNGDAPVPLEGDVFVPRENVDFAQRTPEGSARDDGR